MKTKSKFSNSVLGIFVKGAKLLKFMKVLKVLKPLFFVFTMVLSMAAYSTIFGIVFAILFVVLIFLHEMGHVITLKRYGYKASLPLFIPFVGAVIFAPKFDDRHKEAVVGIGGPILGTLASFVCLIPFYFTHNTFWLAGAFIGIYLNLFNMIPISPLDGGRITQAIHKNFKIVGLLILFIFTLYSKDAGMLLVWILVSSDFEFKRRFLLQWILFLAMPILAFGFGFMHENAVFWIDFSVASILILFNTIFAIIKVKDKKNDEEIKAEILKQGGTIPPEWEKKEVAAAIPVERPILSTQLRVKWLVAFLLLAAIQIVSLIFTKSLLIK